MSLVIKDEYFDSTKEYIRTQCETIESIVLQYIRVMNTIIETGIMEGATAEALKVFLNEIECDLGDNTSNPGSIGIEAERYCTDFITKVDKADKQIY